jgi:hypothetical protein
MISHHETPMRGPKQSLGTLRFGFLIRACRSKSDFRLSAEPALLIPLTTEVRP